MALHWLQHKCCARCDSIDTDTLNTYSSAYETPWYTQKGTETHGKRRTQYTQHTTGSNTTEQTLCASDTTIARDETTIKRGLRVSLHQYTRLACSRMRFCAIPNATTSLRWLPLRGVANAAATTAPAALDGMLMLMRLILSCVYYMPTGFVDANAEMKYIMTLTCYAQKLER